MRSSLRWARTRAPVRRPGVAPVGLIVYRVTRWSDRRALEDVDPLARSPSAPVQADPCADEARGHRRGDGGDGDRARQGAWGGGGGDHGRSGAARVPLEGAAAAGRRGAGASLDRRRRGSRGGQRGRRRCRRFTPARSAMRSSTRRRGGRRPDRPRLGAALAPTVALLLADRRPRPAPRAVRGARGRVPRGGVRASNVLNS